MCGRYRLSRRKEILEEYFDTDSPEEQWTPRYNIAPTQLIPVIRQNPRESVRELSLIRWGLIPSWAKDPSIATKGLSLGPVGGVSTSSSCPALSRMTAIHGPTSAAREQRKWITPGPGRLHAWAMRVRLLTFSVEPSQKPSHFACQPWVFQQALAIA